MRLTQGFRALGAFRRAEDQPKRKAQVQSLGRFVLLEYQRVLLLPPGVMLARDQEVGEAPRVAEALSRSRPPLPAAPISPPIAGFPQ